MPKVTLDPREIPVPRAPLDVDTSGYHSIPIDLEGTRNAEPLVRPSAAGIATESYYARSDGRNSPYNRRLHGALDDIWLREGLVGPLLEANRRLRHFDLEVLILDGYRPVETQRALWSHFLKQAPAGEEPHAYARKYCSDPTQFDERDSRTWPTHMTGGAVDLTLRSIDSLESLDMGSPFDSDGVMSHTGYFESSPISAMPIDLWIAICHRRRILVEIMRQVGFFNYPNEWWHFDRGTQMAIANGQKEPSAWYGVFLPCDGTMARAVLLLSDSDKVWPRHPRVEAERPA